MNMDSINEYLDKNLSEKRKLHTEGVRKTAITLAEKYGEDKEKAQIAALFHDMFRGIGEDILNNYVNQMNLSEKYRNNINLAHGKIAAIIMERDYHITDEDILNAVRYHTTGRPGMSLLEKIIYIADAIEPGRKYPGVEDLRKTAYEDLDRACLLSLTTTIEYVKNQGNFLDTDTLNARDYFLQKEKENG